MKLNALLMSRNPSTLRVLGSELSKIGVKSKWCPSAEDTMELLVRGNFSGVLIDFDLPEATQVAKVARMLSPQRRPVIFAMIGPAATSLMSNRVPSAEGQGPPNGEAAR